MNWLDKMVQRVRSASSDEEAAKAAKDYIDIQEGQSGNSTRDEVHVHLHQGNPDDPDDDNNSKPDPDDDNGDVDMNNLAQRVQALEQQVQALMDMEQEEVELEDPGTQDSRRYLMRRGKGLKARDQDTPVPERTPEMMGETDLPAIEDLNGKQDRVGDSSMQEPLWQDTMAAAEIIVPGIRMPTFDAAHKATLTAKRLCAFRRQTMDAALANPETKEIVASITGLTDPKQFKSLNCDTLKMAFTATAAAIRASNNEKVVSRVAVSDKSKDNQITKVMTPADLNRMNKEFWSKKMNGGATR